VVVKSELHARLMKFFAPQVELVGSPFVAIEREPHALGQHRADDILNPERFGVVDLRLQAVIVEVAAGDFQAVVVDHPAQFRSGVVVDIPVGLDLGVADLANRLEDRWEIALGLVTDRVQLHSERAALAGK
jgi:hypothetical protein